MNGFSGELLKRATTYLFSLRLLRGFVCGGNCRTEYISTLETYVWFRVLY